MTMMGIAVLVTILDVNLLKTRRRFFMTCKTGTVRVLQHFRPAEVYVPSLILMNQILSLLCTVLLKTESHLFASFSADWLAR